MRILLSTAFSLLFFATSAQEMEKDPIDRAAFHLNGEVKTLSEESFRETTGTNGKPTLSKGRLHTWEHDYQLEFDEKGNLLKRTNLNISATDGNEAYTYENGRLVQFVSTYHITSYTYDEKGRIAETTVKTRAKLPSEEDQPSQHVSWVYNEQNQVVKKIHYDLLEKSSEVQNLRYEKGLLVYEEMAAEDYSYRDWFEYKYDAAGNLIQMTWSDDEDGLLERTTYSYTDGKLTGEKWELFDEGESEGHIEYTYVDGNPVKITEVDDEGKIAQTVINSYTFDKHGNWTSCRSVVGKTVYVIKRKLEYY